MKHLDYERFLETLTRYPGTRKATAARRGGHRKPFDSGYCDIVRFFVPGAPPPQTVDLEYEPDCFRFTDERIGTFAARAADRLRETGRLCEGPQTLCVVDTDFTSRTPRMAVRPCRYEDLAGSCFSLDLPDSAFDGRGGTLREYCLRRYGPDPGNSPLPQGLGVCAMVVIHEQERLWTLSPLRSTRLASLEASQGPSVAGSVDYAVSESLQSLFDASLASEAREELNLGLDHADTVLLAFARELFRGGKPQLFGLVRTGRTRAEIEAAAARIDPARREFDRLDWIEVEPDGGIAPEAWGRLNHEARMNWGLVTEYLGRGRSAGAG